MASFGRRTFVAGVAGAGLSAVGCARTAASPEGASGWAGGVPLLLASKAKALLAISVGSSLGAAARESVVELRDYLHRLSGARFAIESDVEGPAIRVEVADLGATALPSDPASSREGYLLRNDERQLWLLGASDAGVSHACVRLLEHLGCRWFFQGREWEVVPRLDDVWVRVDERAAPQLRSRAISYGWGLFESGRGSRLQIDVEAWRRHNRLGGTLEVWTGHAWQAVIAAFKAEFAEHPEYLALVGGKRQGQQLCVSNPAVRGLALRYALSALRGAHGEAMVSLECSDGNGQCECGPCRALGSISDRVFGLANEVARGVARDFPGSWVGLMAYHEHCEPPTFALEPNVYVQLTTAYLAGPYSFDELLELWSKATKNFGIYDYYSVYQSDHDGPAGNRGSNLEQVGKAVPRWIELGATSVTIEGSDSWGPNGLAYYLASKMFWEPRSDVGALLEDFYVKGFGPAAAVMRRYYERLDRGRDPIVSRDLMARAFRDIQEATQLASSSGEILRRLDTLKMYLRYIELQWRLALERDKGRQKELTLAIFTHVYRTRYAYMNHCAGMVLEWTPRAAKDFDEPTWSAHDRSNRQPWRVDTTYTREELEGAFRDGLAFFKPDPVEETIFSTDLAPFPSVTGKDTETQQVFQNGVSYALYSRAGGPLEVSLAAGTLEGYRNRPAARYQLTDSRGSVVAHGRLPLDGEARSLHLRVPHAGSYSLHVEDSGSGWRIRVPAGALAAVVLERGRPFYHLGQMQPMHFYVPRGTREIQYFWSGMPHRVHDPEGALRKEVATDREFVRVGVDPGADGRVWRFEGLWLGQLWFFNVPNYVAASPASLLLPRELLASVRSA